MVMASITGHISELNKTLSKYCDSNFHLEKTNTTEKNIEFKNLPSDNPYNLVLNKIITVASQINLNLCYTQYDDLTFTIDELDNIVQQTQNEVSNLIKQRSIILEEIEDYRIVLEQIHHLEGLKFNFEDIFVCKYVKVRFGKLPVDSYIKLPYYSDKTFFFFPFSNTEEYYWGVYFAPHAKIEKIDKIFSDLFFERIRVPDYAQKTPQEEIQNLNNILSEKLEVFSNIEKELHQIKHQNEELFKKIFCYLKFKSDTYEIREYIKVTNNIFYLVGFVPLSEIKTFEQSFSDFKTVTCIVQKECIDENYPPPVKLKNNRFAQPFEAFVNMYGLPAYKDIDPTFYVAITYTLFFGIMFGDLGQGLVLSLIGYLLFKIKKMDFGRILIRIGFSSAFFGTVYGSVFGFEHLLDPMFHALGFKHKPIEAFEPATSTAILIAAIGIGVSIILISICINIFIGIKQKNFERAILGHNGLAGLLFYGSIITALVLKFTLKINLLNPVFIIILIIVPLLLMFFKHPLGEFIKHKKLHFSDGFGAFFIESFFELFEIILSFVSNTMSFMRIGGFILSHAGMMMVVMSLSEMTGSIGSPIVLIIGNIFVMMMEGLIVGIQVLRLEFYEMFSRYYDGDGKSFSPAKVTYENQKNN